MLLDEGHGLRNGFGVFVRSARNCSFLLFIVLAAFSIQGQGLAGLSFIEGTAEDGYGDPAAGAAVVLRSLRTGLERSAIADTKGRFIFQGLFPGGYELHAESGGDSSERLKVATRIGDGVAVRLVLGSGGNGGARSVGPLLNRVLTGRAGSSAFVPGDWIEYLPILGREPADLSVIVSGVGLDTSRAVGFAPTSGFQLGGQRPRSVRFAADHSDGRDEFTGDFRSTLSRSAVEEVLVSTFSLNGENFGSLGGSIREASRKGGRELSGSAFGFFTDNAFSADLAFAPEGSAFRQVQVGGKLGGRLRGQRTFFFAAYERDRHTRTGSLVAEPSFGLDRSVTLGAPTLPFAQQFEGLTLAQMVFAETLIETGNPALFGTALRYLYFASSGTSTALTGFNPLRSIGDFSPVPSGDVIGSKFLLSGAGIPLGALDSEGFPLAYRTLENLPASFPVRDSADYLSFRIDHVLDGTNDLELSFGVALADRSGVQVETYNQAAGQNDWSRTGTRKIDDLSIGGGWISRSSRSAVNFLNAEITNRGAGFGSGTENATAYNIPGAAFFGPAYFSPFDRTTRTLGVSDSYTQIIGPHVIGAGAELKRVAISDIRAAHNRNGLFDFGPTHATFPESIDLVSGGACPVNSDPSECIRVPFFTPVQAFGLGYPSQFSQGFGDARSRLVNVPLGFFVQDSWRVSRNLTLSAGLRYDIELTQQFETSHFADPLSKLELNAAQMAEALSALGVRKGIPVDRDNFAPRLGLAYDLRGNGATVIRLFGGIFYDSPALAISAISDLADGAQLIQAIYGPGDLSPLSFLNASQIFQGTVCDGSSAPGEFCSGLPQGTVTPGVSAGSDYIPGLQRFGYGAFPGVGEHLPIINPVEESFVYGSSIQGGLSVEQRITDGLFVRITYRFAGSHHLPHAAELNPPDIGKQIENYRRCFGRLPASVRQVAQLDPSQCNAPGGVFVNVIPGIISVNSATGEGVILPSAANFFRPNAPNYFLVSTLTNGATTPEMFDAALASTNTLRTPGIISPFGSVIAQVSNGNSDYNSINLDIHRRFTDIVSFRASYSWSHVFDDSTDFPATFIAQDPNDFRVERGDSYMDQRHHFVFSGVFASPAGWARSGSLWKRLFSGLTVAPIVRIRSGKPFNIVTGIDRNGDLSYYNDRPNGTSDGTLLIPEPFTTGALARNRGVTHHIKVADVQISRSFSFGERFRLEAVGEVYNLFNRFNEASASPYFDDANRVGDRSGGKSYFSRTTNALDPRLIRFGLRFRF
ncbi:MAG: carboxypeptidase regulatory-like domain-containing protein [Aridibacter famidurans]|nr:carboxypeptidase regulatory-like domain-containing protein [Aridibacter famidurans]